MERKMDVTQKSTIELLALAREYLQPNSRKGFDSKWVKVIVKVSDGEPLGVGVLFCSISL